MIWVTTKTWYGGSTVIYVNETADGTLYYLDFSTDPGWYVEITRLTTGRRADSDVVPKNWIAI
jgi:hypothetical protein